MLSVQNYNLTSGRNVAFKSHENDEKIKFKNHSKHMQV